MTYFRGDRRGIIRKRYFPTDLKNMCSTRVFRSRESVRSFVPTTNFYGRQNVCCRGSHVFRSIKSISISRDCTTAFTSPSHTPQNLTHTSIVPLSSPPPLNVILLPRPESKNTTRL